MTTEAQITAWLATQQDAMIAELKEMVNTDGGSYDKAGVDRTGTQVKRFLEGHGRFNLVEYLESWLESATDKSFALFYFNQVSEIPCKFFCEVKVILNILCVNVLVVKYAGK